MLDTKPERLLQYKSLQQQVSDRTHVVACDNSDRQMIQQLLLHDWVCRWQVRTTKALEVKSTGTDHRIFAVLKCRVRRRDDPAQKISNYKTWQLRMHCNLRTTELPEKNLMAIHCMAAERGVLIKKERKREESSAVKLKAFQHTCRAA